MNIIHENLSSLPLHPQKKANGSYSIMPLVSRYLVILLTLPFYPDLAEIVGLNRIWGETMDY